jgi:hypothetical protein
MYIMPAKEQVLDLDIGNYSIDDIARFFRFEPDAQYAPADIELREAEIREQLLQSGHIDKRMKRDLIDFLLNAKRRLIDARSSNLAKRAPTSVPKDYRLDTADYPRSKEATRREAELVHKPAAQFVYTANSDYFQGAMNPLEKRVVTKNVCIDTLFRQNHSATKNTDFVYAFPKELKNVTSLQLTSFEFPNKWDKFSASRKNTEMTIYLFNMPFYAEDMTHAIIIPCGNYTAEQFARMMNNRFMDASGGLEFLRVEIDPTTSATVFRINSDTFEPRSAAQAGYVPEDFYFVLDFTLAQEPNRPLYRNMGWMLGFRKKWYNVKYGAIHRSYNDISANAITYNGYLRSESYFGNFIDTYLFVEIDDFHNNFPTDSIISLVDPETNAYIGKNIIARIAIPSGIETAIIMDNASDRIFKRRDYFGPVNMEKIRVRLLDRFGDVINLNSSDFSFTLEAKQLYS